VAGEEDERKIRGGERELGTLRLKHAAGAQKVRSGGGDSTIVDEVTEESESKKVSKGFS